MPQDLLTCAHVGSSHPLRARSVWRAIYTPSLYPLQLYPPSADHWVPPQVAPTLGSTILPGNPQHRMFRNLPAHTLPQHQLRCQGTSSTEHPGTPQFALISASSVLLRCPQYIEPWDTIACIEFSFSCPDMVPIICKSPRPAAHNCSQPQLQPARKSH